MISHHENDRSDVLTAPEFCERTGLTYRQVDNWTRLGLLTYEQFAPRSGNTRYYNEADVPAVTHACTLALLGIVPWIAMRAGRELAARRKTTLGPFELAVPAPVQEVLPV